VLWVGAPSPSALRRHRLDGGSGVLRLLLLPVADKVTLLPSLTLPSPLLLVSVVIVYVMRVLSAFFNLCIVRPSSPPPPCSRSLLCCCGFGGDIGGGRRRRRKRMAHSHPLLGG